MESIDPALIDWSRAQFALTAIYHWLFVPLTLGLSFIVAIMESRYVRTGDEFWARTARFWMRLFGINFALGVATGLILEFEFGTNWSNYSWLVGDIFGAPLAIEGILAFFMESTFVAVMFFGWNKVGKKFHLASTWLTCLGAAISAWWILVANAWMQAPVGVAFNPDTVRHEMMDFFAVAFSPVAVFKFIHSILSGWVLGAAFVIGVSAWYLLKKRETDFALKSIRMAAVVGLTASVLAAWSGDFSGRQLLEKQPMKLAALEALYEGGQETDLSVIGIVNTDKDWRDGAPSLYGGLYLPKGLSLMATHTPDGYVPGIKDILEGGYPLPDGSLALSAREKIDRGRRAVQALADYRQSRAAGDEAAAVEHRRILDENVAYFGYGYLNAPEDLIPNVPLNYYAFRVMVGLGLYFILFFSLILFLTCRKDLSRYRWLLYVALFTIPLGYLAGQTGWIVAECGRQPWAIQDVLPVSAAVSDVGAGAVMTTFFLFLALFSVMLAVGISLMVKSVRKGPAMVELQYK